MKNKRIKNILRGLSAVMLSFIIAIPSYASDMEPDLNKKVGLQIELKHNEEVLEGKADVYRIAEMKKADNGNVSFKVLDAYKKIHGELGAHPDKQGYARDFAEGITKETLVAKGVTDKKGIIEISSDKLSPGMYLVIPKDVKSYVLEPFLVSLPQYEETEQGYTWKYDVTCEPKKSRKKPRLPKTSKPKIPKTGDSAMPFEYAAGGISALVLILICIYIKKSQNR